MAQSHVLRLRSPFHVRCAFVLCAQRGPKELGLDTWALRPPDRGSRRETQRGEWRKKLDGERGRRGARGGASPPHPSLASVAVTHDPRKPDAWPGPRPFPGKRFSLPPVSSEKSGESTPRERVCTCLCSPRSLPLCCRYASVTLGETFSAVWTPGSNQGWRWDPWFPSLGGAIGNRASLTGSGG